MQVINFVLVFGLGLVIALFSLENTQIVTLQIIPGIKYDLPLSVETIIAMGLGAIFAWFFSGWMNLQQWLIKYQKSQEIKIKERQIQELVEDVEQLQAQIEQPSRYLPMSES